MDLNKKHYTAISPTEANDKLNRYTFLDRSNTQVDEMTKKSRFVHNLTFPAERNGVFSLRYNNDSSKIVASYGNGLIEVLDAEHGFFDYIVREAPEEPVPIMCVRCVPGTPDVFFAAGISGQILTCRFEAGSCKRYVEEKLNEINSIDIDMNATLMISGGKDATIRLYDLATGKLKAKFLKQGRDYDDTSVTQFHAMRIFAVKFHPTEENIFLSGGWDDTLKIWDVRIRNGCVKNIIGPRICGEAIDVRDKHILTGSWTVNNSLQIWDLTSGRLIESINPSNRVQTLDGEFLYCCQYFKNDRHDLVIAAGGGTSNLEIISLKDQKILSCYKANKCVQAIDSNSLSFITYGGMDRVIKILHIV